MRAADLAKSNTESAHQIAFFSYCTVARHFGFEVADFWDKTGMVKKNEGEPIDGLEWIHHIPNGGSRGSDAKSRAIRGAKLKAEGVKSGVIDIFWPNPIGSYCGLYIEMKAPKEKPKKSTSKGGLSEDQIKFGNYVMSVGYCVKVCYTYLEAVNALKEYCGYNLN